mmetsp:Transcript_44366/g.44892  ORF Transcript_44366/g.44892 Transcript_44366/m.44892 type:complete len:96 (+) Transcript_44366:756-1043(+)
MGRSRWCCAHGRYTHITSSSPALQVEESTGNAQYDQIGLRLALNPKQILEHTIVVACIAVDFFRGSDFTMGVFKKARALQLAITHHESGFHTIES